MESPSHAKKEAHFLGVQSGTKPSPRKLAEVKRIARHEQLGLTSASVAVHLGFLIDHDKLTGQLR
jgi:hypothetical protein